MPMRTVRERMRLGGQARDTMESASVLLLVVVLLGIAVSLVFQDHFAPGPVAVYASVRADNHGAASPSNGVLATSRHLVPATEKAP